MPQFRAEADKDYYNPASGQSVRYSADQLKNDATGWLSSQFRPGTPSLGAEPGATPGALPGQDAASPGVQYNADGTRSELSEYYDSLKPESPEQRAAREAQMRSEKQGFMQQQIDAVNAMYADILKRAQIQGESRIGSTATSQALSGQRGAPSGQAMMEKTKQFNLEEQAAIDRERNAKIQEILSDFEFKMDASIREERELRTKDADAWVKYKQGEVDKHREMAQDLRSQFINAQLSPDEIDEASWLKMAEVGGYSVNQAKALYKSEYEKVMNEWTRKEMADLAGIQYTQASTSALTDQTATRREEFMISQGYNYLKTPEERKQWEDKGRKTVKIAGREYLMPDDTQTAVVTANNQVKLINTQTGETIQVLGSANDVTGSGVMSEKDFLNAATINMQASIAELFAQGIDVTGGYLNPNAWNAYRKQWITQVGSPGEFDQRFDSYIDPSRASQYEKGGRLKDEENF